MKQDGRPDAAAVVLKVGRYPGHHGGLAAIRSLGGMGVATYAVVEHERVPAASSAHLTGAFVWPTGTANATGDHLVEALERIITHVARPSVVVPTDDRAASLLNEIAARLPADLLVPACPAGLCARLADKQSFAEEAARAGLLVPEQQVLQCPLSARALDALTLPLIVKRATPRLRADGSRSFSTLLIRDKQTLAEALQGDGLDSYEAIVQDPIDGEDWLYHGYFDAESNAVVGFTGRKVRSWPPYAGETAFGVARANPPLREAVEAFLREIGYVGPVGLDLRLDRRAGVYRVLDVNPRLCASFRLFVNGDGIDVVRAMYLDLSGSHVPRSPQVEGRTYLVENYDWRARRAYGLTGLRGTTRWLRSLRRADELAWVRRGDLLPAAKRAWSRVEAATPPGDIHPHPPWLVRGRRTHA